MSERDSLERLLSEDDFSIAQIEDLGYRSILPYIFEAGKYEVIIYGAAGQGYDCLCWLKYNNIEPLCMADGDMKKHNSVYFGKEVIHIDSLHNKISGKDVYVLVCTNAWYDSVQRHFIQRKLNRAVGRGSVEIYHFEPIASPWRYWTPYYKMNSEHLLRLYDELCDEESKNALYEYVRAVILDNGYLGVMHDSYEKYIAPDIYEWLEDERILDCGAFCGDTIFSIVRAKRTFEKIYAIEAEYDSLKKVDECIKYLPGELQSKIELHHLLLGAQELSPVFDDARITLIKTDLEGADYNALVGFENIIREQMPVLAVSVYHLDTDLVKIPNYIKSISSSYRLYLRKYYAYTRKFLKNELVLYAIPPNRGRGKQ